MDRRIVECINNESHKCSEVSEEGLNTKKMIGEEFALLHLRYVICNRGLTPALSTVLSAYLAK